MCWEFLLKNPRKDQHFVIKADEKCSMLHCTEDVLKNRATYASSAHFASQGFFFFFLFNVKTESPKGT